MVRLLLLMVVCSALHCADGESRPSLTTTKPNITAPYRADGRYIRDPEGRALLLHGVNWNGSWKWAPFGADVTDGEARHIASLGLNSVRMLTHWGKIMPVEGEIDASYLAEFRRRVELAAKYDLMVIVDMHQDIYGFGIKNTNGHIVGNGAPAWACSATVEPVESWFFYYLYDEIAHCVDALYTNDYHIEQFTKSFAAIIDAVADLDNVIGFELLNEPFVGTSNPFTFENEVLLPFYEKVYAGIEGRMKNYLLFAEPAVLKNVLAETRLKALPGRNTVYAPHLYDPGMEFGEAYDDDDGLLTYRADKDLREALYLNAPLWWGEWGNAPSGPSAEKYIRDFTAVADAAFVGRAYWDYSQLLRTDATGGGSHVAHGLARAYVERAPGEPSFQFDPESLTLTIQLKGDGTTETWVRAPQGWKAAASLGDGWTGESRQTNTPYTRLRLPPAPAGQAVRATVSFTL